jgi:hypothetical protein
MSANTGIALPVSPRTTATRPAVSVNRETEEEPKSDRGRTHGRPVATQGASDDEILGLNATAADSSHAASSKFDWDGESVSRAGADASKAIQEERDERADRPDIEAVLGANPELKQAWDDARAYRESFRTPEDARVATSALAELAKMDALFFSGRPQDHAELARVVASLDPAAFQSLAKAMAEVATRPPTGTSDARATDRAPVSQADPVQVSAPGKQDGVTPAHEQFFQSTNAAAVQAVVDAIESQVERLLPEDVSKGAHNRLVGEIYRELDASLRADRQFGSQAREAFRSGRLDEEHRRAIVSMVNNRARQALPAVSRRVLNEWTSAIVAANQDRRARQRAAERRVDIAGSGRTGNDGTRPMTPKDINYSRMSDSDILNL